MNKKLLLFLFVFSFGTASAQFTDEQLTLLTKLNCALKGAWVMDGPNVENQVAGRSNSPNDVEEVEFSLFNYKTWEYGTNQNEEGEVAFSIFQKSKAKETKEEFESTEEEKVIFIETKSFLVVVQYKLDFNDFYDKEMKEIIPAIKAWFKDNSEKL